MLRLGQGDLRHEGNIIFARELHVMSLHIYVNTSHNFLCATRLVKLTSEMTKINDCVSVTQHVGIDGQFLVREAN